MRSEERQGHRFSELIAQGLDDQRLHALMSLRADFLGRLQNDEPLYGVHHKIDVPPLREAELREVVSRPAALLSARFETESLAYDIARRAEKESAKDAGALTLLSYLLDDMWRKMIKRGDGVLRLPPQAVELGGVLVQRADDFLANHPAAEEALRHILTIKLANVREDSEPTRRRARRAEFTDAEWRLVSELADYPNRLLVTATTEGGETYAEVAHEAIFRLWQKLRDWMTAERDFLIWKSGLEADRRRWEGAPAGSKNDALLLGLALAQAQSWQSRVEDLPKPDREFIDLSLKRDAVERERWKRMRRAMIVVGAAAVVLVLAFGGVASYQWFEAERHRTAAAEMKIEQQKQAMEQQAALASRNFQLAVTSAQKLLDQVGDSLNYGDISAKGAKDMLNVASEIVEQVHNVESTPETIALLVKLAWTASDIHATLGNLTQAYDSAKSARDLLEPLYAADPGNPKVLGLLYNSIWRMGDALFDQGFDPAVLQQVLMEYQQAEKLARRLVEMAPEDGGRQRNVVFILQKIGDVRQALEDWPSAIAVYSAALEIMQSVVARAPANRDWQRDLANSLSRLGQALAGKGDLDAALEQYRAAFKIRSELAAADRMDDVLQSNLATSHREIARLYAQRGDLDAALAEYRIAIGIREDLLTKDPTNANWQISLAPIYAGAGEVLRRKGDLAAALEQYRKAYTLRQDLAIKDPTNPGRQYSFAIAGMSVADVLVAQNQDLDEAVKLYRAAIEILDDLRPRYDRDVFRCYIKIGDILRSRGDPEGALTEYKRASAIARQSAAKDPTSAPWQRNLADSYAKIGGFLIEQGRTREALEHYKNALEFVEELAAKRPTNIAWTALVQSLKAEVQKLASKP